MLDFPNNCGKMKSLSNFKLNFSERGCVVVRGSLFEFGVIRKLWVPEIIN